MVMRNFVFGKRAKQELNNQLRSCKEDFKNFERQDVKYREDLSHMKQKIKKLEDKLEKMWLNKVSELIHNSTNSQNLDKAGVSVHFQEIVDLNDGTYEAVPGSDFVITRVAFWDNSSKYYINDRPINKKLKLRYCAVLAKVRAELEPWEKQLIERKGKLEVTCTESKLLSEKHEAGLAAFEDAQKQVDVILGKLKTKTASIADIQTDIEKNLEVLGARKVEQECIKEQDALIPIEQAARQKVAELNSILDTEKGQGSVLKAILQAKESNRIEGIYGRMGDLGAIDAKYDVAISTACPALDYFVVETTGAAQACVELLWRENLGEAN